MTRTAATRCSVLVTDGQVGNEDQVLRQLGDGLRGVRVHTVGIDQAVNAGFLRRLAEFGGGRCELVESEDRLDDAMDAIHRRINAPLAHRLRLQPDGLAIIDDAIAPVRLPDLFSGVPLVVAGRYRGPAKGSLTVTDGEGQWSAAVTGQQLRAAAVTAQWARAHLRDLEDRYICARDVGDSEELEQRIVDCSLRFGVLCRFTAFVAVDSRVVAEGAERHRVLQPVEAPAGWDMFATRSAVMAAPAAMTVACAAPPPMAKHLDMHSAPASFDQILGLPQGFDDTGAVPVADADVQLAAARKEIRDEVRRMRAAGQLTDDERRTWLAELALRIDALLGYLSAQGVPRSAYKELSTLHSRLERAGNSGKTLWDYALRQLDAFATGSPAKRRQFWKRG